MMARRGAAKSARTQLAKKIGTTQVPDALWNQLVEEGFTVTLEPTDQATLARVAKERLEIMQRAFAEAAATQERIPMTPEGEAALASYSPYERERTLAQSEYVAQKVAMMPAVRRFRAEVLGGRLLTPKEADAFVTAADSRQSEGGGKLVVLYSTGKSLHLQHIRPDSPLDQLRLLCRDILPLTPWKGWQMEGAGARFILTGEVPLILPVIVEAEHRNERQISRSLIHLSIDPWVPAETVMQQYRAAQRAVLGGDTRMLSMRNLAVFRFVTARTDDRGERPPWADLMAEWNAAHPDEMYKELRLFSRDYRRMEQVVTVPPFAWRAAEAMPADEAE